MVLSRRHAPAHDDDQQVVEDVGLGLGRPLAEELLLRADHLVGDLRQQALAVLLLRGGVVAHGTSVPT